MKWVVEGADAVNGTEMIIEVEAADERAARLEAKKHRILVSSVEPITDVVSESSLADAAQAYRAVPYATSVRQQPAVKVTPPESYRDISRAAGWVSAFGFVLSVVGGLSIFGGGALFLGGLLSLIERRAAAYDPAPTYGIGLLFSGLFFLAMGALLRLFAGMGVALRELTMNSRR